MIVGFVKCGGGVQTVIVSIPVYDGRIKGRPLELSRFSGSVQLRSSGFLHTPEFESGLAVASAPTAVPFGPAVTTSRRELPVAIFPPGRRPLPLRALAVLVATFSFVLDASDLESSG